MKTHRGPGSAPAHTSSTKAQAPAKATPPLPPPGSGSGTLLEFAGGTSFGSDPAAFAGPSGSYEESIL